MTALWTSTSAAAATGGRAVGPAWHAGGIVIDSRRTGPGDLFVALPGERTDGHDHVADAGGRGAAAAMVERTQGLPARLPMLVVPDCLEALARLGAAARSRSAARVTAVTGSVGKTGTKDMLGRALAAFGEVEASSGNLNNHIGAPLSLARMRESVAYGVFELGMNHAGEIGPLSSLVRPHLAIITTVGPVHIGHFPDEEAIARAKAEIFDGMEPGGCAVLNRDNRWYGLLREAAARDTISRVLTFGRHPDADVRLVEARCDTTGSTVTVVIDDDPLTYRLDAVGEHWAANSAGVLACVIGLGLDARRAAEAIRSVVPGRGRGAQLSVALAGGGSIRVVDEAYNASPVAMRAAFRVLADARPGPGGRRVAVLGDMLELGPAACRMHAGLADDLMAAGPELVFTVGPLMQALRVRLPPGVSAGHAETSAGIVEDVLATVRDGDVVLVKGSLGTNMSPVIAALEALATCAEGAG